MSDKIKGILKKSGYDFNYQIEESHVYSLMQQAYNLDRPTPPVQAKTAEEILAAQFNTTADLLDTTAHCRVSSALRAIHAYYAQFTPLSDKTVGVEEAKSEKLPEYKFRKFKITGITPDAYVELNNEEIKNINGMIPCLASRLVDYPYMFVMPDGKSCHSDWLLFETFESEKQGKEGGLKCIMGCKIFTGGEIKHHKDCPYYSDSLSRTFDEQTADLVELREENERLKAENKIYTDRALKLSNRYGNVKFTDEFQKPHTDYVRGYLQGLTEATSIINP